MNLLIKNALAVLPEGTVPDSSVWIKDGVIVAVNDAPQDFRADKVLDAKDKLLVPGFVNAHTHVHMTALRNRADDLKFMTWLFDRVIPMEDKLTQEDAYWSIQLAFMEMLESGITTFSDMHMFPDVVIQATLDAGMRGAIGLDACVERSPAPPMVPRQTAQLHHSLTSSCDGLGSFIKVSGIFTWANNFYKCKHFGA